MNEVTLKEPQDLRQDTPKRMEFDVAKRAPLSDVKMAELERQIKETLEEEISNTSIMRRRLNTLNDVLEGVTEEVNSPFPNSSDIDVRMGAGTARTMRATMTRALFSDPDRAFVASIDDESRRREANEVEGAFNWQAAHENGLIDALKDAIIPVFRDGTAFIQGVWKKDVQKVIDYRSYITPDEFMADYPEQKDSGISEEKYTEIIRHLAEPDSSLDISFEQDYTKSDGAQFSIVTLPRFHWWPVSARSLDECEFYGVKMEESEVTMKKKAKTKEYWSAVVDSCLAATKEGGSSDQWNKSRDFIEGISRQNSKRKEFENYRLVLTVDLDGDDIPEKYMGVFNPASGKFLNFGRYKIRHNINFLIPVRFDRRDDRLLGKSLLYDGMDIFGEITDIHRSRNNNRMITDAVGFKAEDTLKDSIEFQLANWRPGVVIWTPPGKMDSVQQFIIENRSNTQNSLDEENALRNYVEFIIGPTQGLSGQETKGDASAPATKHLSKIRQAGYRIDDYIDEFKRSFPEIGELAMALEYQYGLREIKYRAKGEDGSPVGKTIKRDLFGIEGLSIDLNARSVIMSPEFEMERIMALYNTAAANPQVMTLKPQILGILWDRFVVASRTMNPEELKLGELASQPVAPQIPGMPGGATVPGMPGNGAAQTAGVGNRMPPLRALLAGLGMSNPAERPQR